LASDADDESYHSGFDVEPNGDHSRVLISQAASLTKEQVIQSIPPKEVSDKLLWHWFNSGSPALRTLTLGLVPHLPWLAVIHKPTFAVEVILVRLDDIDADGFSTNVS
jgi:hypothetical protein